MIIVLKRDSDGDDIRLIYKAFEGTGLILREIRGEDYFMIGLAGDTSFLEPDSLMRIGCVKRVIRISEPYKLAGRRFHSEDSLYDIAGRKIGGGHFTVIAGPCSVESEEQILSVAVDVRNYGADFLRGGAFKPRSSPYAFKGLGLDGLELLRIAKEKTGLPLVSEIMSAEHLELFAEYVDIIQIGARNMQNFALLREVGGLKKPVLLKRGLSATIDELLMAAEYIMVGGSSEIILCERGIRTFETAARNTLDLSAVPILKEKSHLPVIVDPSHATGLRRLVEPMSLAAAACGADGLIIEVHNKPETALCDGAQSITPPAFLNIMQKIKKIRACI